MLLDNNIIALTPAKTGSSSLLNFLMDNSINVVRPEVLPVTPFRHLLLSEIVSLYSINSLENYNIVISVREPYARMVSSYYHIQELYYDFFNKKLFKNFLFFCDSLKDHKHLLNSDTDMFYAEFFKSERYREYSFKQNHWGGLRFLFEQSRWEDVAGATVRPFKLEHDKFLQAKRYFDLDGTNYPASNKGIGNISDVYNSRTVDIVQELYYNDYIKYGYSFI